MKKHFSYLLISLLAITFLSSGCSKTSNSKKELAKPEVPQIKVGSNVAANDGTDWFPGTITAINGTKYEVKYSNNSVETVDSKNLKLVLPDPKLDVDDKVLANFGGAFVSCNIRQVIKKGYVVTCGTNDTPTEIEKGKLIKLSVKP